MRPDRLPGLWLVLLAGLPGCGRSESVSVAPPPGPSTTTAAAPQLAPPVDGAVAFPRDLDDGRVRIIALTVFPSAEDYQPVLRNLFDAWAECARQHPPACGYQVFSAAVDRHRAQVSRGVLVDRLDGPVEVCIGEATTKWTGAVPGELSPLWSYTVALGVAPSPGEMEGCTSGAAADVDRWVTRTGATPVRSAP